MVGTRQARGDRKNWARFLVDFEGGELDALPEDSGITSVVEVDGAKLVQKHLEKNPIQEKVARAGFEIATLIHQSVLLTLR